MAMGETVMRFSSRISRSWNGANIGAAGLAGLAGFLPEPALDAFQPVLVAQAEVLVADALAAGQQRISELQRLEMEVALERLEPFGRVAGAVLQLEHLEVPLGDIFEHRRVEGQARTVQHLGQLDRILERQLGARADREMGGVGGVAEQDELAVVPALALDAAEVEPGGRADEVGGVGLERVAVEIFGEQFFAGGDGLGLVHAVEAEAAPGLFRTFDDEGRAVGREAVGVGPDPAVLGLFEGEGEGVEGLDVPSQTNLLARVSTSTPKWSA